MGIGVTGLDGVVACAVVVAPQLVQVDAVSGPLSLCCLKLPGAYGSATKLSYTTSYPGSEPGTSTTTA